MRRREQGPTAGPRHVWKAAHTLNYLVLFNSMQGAAVGVAAAHPSNDASAPSQRVSNPGSGRVNCGVTPSASGHGSAPAPALPQPESGLRNDTQRPESAAKPPGGGFGGLSGDAAASTTHAAPSAVGAAADPAAATPAAGAAPAPATSTPEGTPQTQAPAPALSPDLNPALEPSPGTAPKPLPVPAPVPDAGAVKEVWHCAVSLAFLQRFAADTVRPGWTTYDILQRVVLPATSERRCVRSRRALTAGHLQVNPLLGLRMAHGMKAR